MNRTEAATTDGESDEFNHDRSECPKCGKDIYYEPRIRHGTQYEATSGWCCTHCSWSQIDPDSGRSRPSRTERARQSQRFHELRNALCDECGNDEFEATYHEQPSADPLSNFEAVPVIACTDCGAVVVTEPGPGVFEVFDE